MSEDRHPGISMHRLPVGGGFVGLLFALGCSLIFVLGFPSLWYFVAFSAALGLGVALILRIVSRYRSERNKPLSILAAPQKTQSPIPPTRETPRNLFHALPKPFSI